MFLMARQYSKWPEQGYFLFLLFQAALSKHGMADYGALAFAYKIQHTLTAVSKLMHKWQQVQSMAPAMRQQMIQQMMQIMHGFLMNMKSKMTMKKNGGNGDSNDDDEEEDEEEEEETGGPKAGMNPNMMMGMNPNMMMGMNPQMMQQMMQQQQQQQQPNQFGGAPAQKPQTPQKEDPFAQFGMNAFR